MQPIKVCEEYKIILWIKTCTDTMVQYQHQYLQLLSSPARAELLQLRKTLNGFAKRLVTYPMSSLTLFATVLQEFTTWTLLQNGFISGAIAVCTEVYGAIFRLFITPPCCSCCIGYLAFLGPTPTCHMARREFATMGTRLHWWCTWRKFRGTGIECICLKRYGLLLKSLNQMLGICGYKKSCPT